MKDKAELMRQLEGARPGDSAPGTKVVPIAPQSDDEECETPSFGFLRGIRDRALNIEFRRSKEGDEVSFPYCWLGLTRYHPSVGIQILFTGSELYLVTLRGRNLNSCMSGVSLYDRGLLRHRVTWVREASRDESRLLPESTCIIERIEIQRVSEEEAASVFTLTVAEPASGSRSRSSGSVA
jgi:hypothetical protein